MKILITKQLRFFLEKKEFVNIATCDDDGRPNVAPKFLVTVDDNDIYFADYVFGRTFKNLKINPQVSLATMDMDSLIGYQFNGIAHILDKGQEYARLLKNTQDKQIKFSVERVIEGVHREKKFKNFEVTFPDSIVIFKVNVKEVVAINPQGHLERTKL